MVTIIKRFMFWVLVLLFISYLVIQVGQSGWSFIARLWGDVEALFLIVKYCAAIMLFVWWREVCAYVCSKFNMADKFELVAGCGRVLLVPFLFIELIGFIS